MNPFQIHTLIHSLLNTKYNNIFTKKFDISNHEEIEIFVDNATKILSGNPDILINNAGITRDNLSLRMSIEEWNEVLNLNLTSTFLLCKSSLRKMIKNKYGKIVNITSVVGHTGNVGQANYAASKSGIIGFSKSIALELGSRNIRTNAIAPGFIETEMTEKLPEETIKQWRNGIPLKRGGTVEDVANLCLFLASDSSSYITGQVINVDGGMLT